jgi:4-hydroxy-tetrahydrodipicolinate synthase
MSLTTAELRDRLRGPVVAMTTPFNRDLSLDLGALRRLTEFYVESGVRTVIAAGSTGEFASLSDDERRQVIQAVVEEARGRVTVIAGCAHSGTQLAAELVKFAETIGADGCMITPPYYGFDGIDGLYRHYSLVAEASPLPVVIYFSGAVLPKVQNIVADPRLLYRLCEVPTVAGFKDATGNWAFQRDIALALKDRVAVMGSAGMNHYLWGHMFGAPCYLTGLGNIWPKVELDFFDALERGDRAAALKIVVDWDIPYLKAAVKHNYFAAVKLLLDAAGLPGGGPMRPPLLDWPSDAAQDLRDKMTQVGLLRAPAATGRTG